MKLVAYQSLFATLLLSLLGIRPSLGSATFDDTLVPFLEEHCLACHGEEKQKGKRRFDALEFPIVGTDALIDFQDILDLLNLGEMPPEDEPQPGLEEKAAVVAWLTEAVAQAHAQAASTGGETVLRRLSNREYSHSIGDLLGLQMEGFDPTAAFPSDAQVEHLDNVGDALVTSGFLLQAYLDAASVSVEKALPDGKRPEVEKWTFTDGFRQQPEFDGRRRKQLGGLPYLLVCETLDTQRHFASHAPLLDFAEGVPHDGVYKIRLRVEPCYRKPQYADQKPIDLFATEEDALLAVVPGDASYGELHLAQPLEPILATFRLPEAKEPQWVEAEIFLHAGTSPRFSYLNGLLDARPVSIKLGEMEVKERNIDTPNDLFGWSLTHAKFPQIRIHEVQIEGPFYPEGWPSAARRGALPATNGKFAEEDIPGNLRTFANRAFRRPVTDEELNAYLSLTFARRAEGATPRQAYRDALKAILCSPNFLYLDEPAQPSGALEAHALATRLSYFLWSSLPDATLNEAAESGDLLAAGRLEAEFDRMLADPKLDRFITGFLDAWLTLRALGDTPPDRAAFREYYIYDIRRAMRTETEMYARHLLDENLPIGLFLDSDFTFLNRPLARVYRLPYEDLSWQQFERVTLNKRNRGGLFGMGSVLAVTANGVDTSPIVRGVWILENILGTPTSPPPPDIEALDPDTRGATTVRDLLEKHRADPACAECHRKIDPLGFALEVFDPIGQYRSTYGKNRPIDGTGTLPGGWEFENVGSFKDGIKKHHESFARALTSKLLAYALGRRLEITDRPTIDAILAEAGEDDEIGFRELVKGVALSEAMQRP